MRLATHLNTALMLAVAVSFLAACGNNKSFDSEAWMKADRRERGRMSEDLVKRKILIGKTVDEAKRVLGQPDKDYVAALEYRIDLGWPMKDPIHYGLQVHLDQDRKVREVKIVD